MTTRSITHTYEDPIDRVWLTTAERIGLRVKRSGDVYASTDGRGTLTIGEDATLDADDCLAQMIFHELCHSLVQGPESLEQVDWGLDNESERDVWREHACLRLQAHLAGHHGLTWILAPTTEHRTFYDSIVGAPLDGDDDAVRAAKIGAVRSRRDPWDPHLEEALTATAQIAQLVSRSATAPSLWSRASVERSPNRAGLPLGPDRTCGECAWRRGSTCLQARRRTGESWRACDRFEPALDCRSCGACCREAYGVVELAPRDPFVKKHPELVQEIDGRKVLLRVGGRCPALEGERSYTCRVYEDRPRTCRDFTLGSPNCLEARRRVGLSL
jgi:hypothetical protein